jgi:hypothetical protein
MAGYIHADIVKVVHSPDGAFKVDFLRRKDGLYEYRGWERRREETPIADGYYWGPREHSGLYQTMEELEQMARQTVPWLQAMPTSEG